MADDLVAYFVDRAREKGVNPPRSIVGALAKQVGTLTKEGQPPELIRDTLDLALERAAPPSQLPALLMVAALNPPEARLRKRLLQEQFDRYGWPTGARFVRGTHAGTFVRDVLGYDKVTEHDWENARPSRQEVGDLLMALHAIGEFFAAVRQTV